MRRSLLALVAVLVLFVALPGVAAAESRSGGTVVVGPNETVEEDLEAFGGTVLVRGTVEGNLSAVGGDVTIAESGTVTGNVEASGGSITIAGSVGGDVQAGGGSVRVTDAAQIDGSLAAGAGAITVDGTVGGDAELGADTIRLGSGAVIDGDLTYDGNLTQAENATVGGTVTRDESLSVGTPAVNVPGGVFPIYGLLVNLLVGAVLLYVFPEFSAGVAERVARDPGRTALVGVVTAIAIPILLALVAITVVGIPLSIAGFLLYGLLVWIATIYGRYALGEWLLSFTDLDGPWLALLIGVVGVAILTFVPVVGWIVELAVFVLGFGALLLGLWYRYQGRTDRRPTSADAGGF